MPICPHRRGLEPGGAIGSNAVIILWPGGPTGSPGPTRDVLVEADDDARATIAVLSWAAVAQNPFHEPFPAHKVIGNVYYVGSKDLASYLITTPEGHVLINSGFEETVPLIRKSVESLGFKLGDVKILLNSHVHSDHVAGLATLKDLTGAKVYVMRGDDEVKLGGVTLVARRTPGHTRGCTTWTWKAEDGGKAYDMVVIGSPNVNPGYRLVGNKGYPEIADDFAKTFKVLKALPCDAFLGAHGGYYGMVEKHARAEKGHATNPFFDPEGYRAYVAQKAKAFRDTLADQQAAGARDSGR
jgi:metallo-beta-lactamase class B